MELHNVSFSYQTKKPLIEALSGEIKKNKITTIVGPNGSGKSTMLAMLARQLAPSRGEILFNGKKLVHFKGKELAQQLAVVYQKNEAPLNLSVRKLVSYGRHPYWTMIRSWTSEDERAVDEALSVTRLTHYANVSVDSLSGGEQQRVWLALALAQETDVILLDEPTTYLDLYHQFEILERVRLLNQSKAKTVVMVLHDLNQALQYSDDVWVMKAGRLVAKGSAAEVLTSACIRSVFQIETIIHSNEQSGSVLVPIGTATGALVNGGEACEVGK
ncbi:ferrichrome transport ATP-binding protein FhuC [Bacillus sp. JCM 19046]|nr:ferrichrome transport ATP-binding protein FhuC [Bacillus sp. JCM 19045]GAF20074.1 ferrichrome transport ATP-binding protein FhuC [Bacillus sp. JCM 19046]